MQSRATARAFARCMTEISDFHTFTVCIDYLAGATSRKRSRVLSGDELRTEQVVALTARDRPSLLLYASAQQSWQAYPPASGARARPGQAPRRRWRQRQRSVGSRPFWACNTSPPAQGSHTQRTQDAHRIHGDCIGEWAFEFCANK